MRYASHPDAPGGVRRRTGSPVPKRRRAAAGSFSGPQCALWIAVALLCAPPLGSAEPGGSTSLPAAAEASPDTDISVDVVEHGTSSRRVKREAIQQLPLDQLTRDSRVEADKVLNDLSLFRRLPVVRVDADPRLLKFFTDYPEVAVGIWRAMDITTLSMTPKGLNTYESDSGDGSVGLITVLYRDAHQQLIHCEGLFKSPVLAKPIKARALMHLQTESTVEAAGRPLATCKADVFVSFPSTTVETVARVVSPVSNRIADRNFEEVAMFVRMMHVAMTQQPGWVEQIARRMDGVTQQRKEEMLDLMARVYVDARRRTASSQMQTLTPESLRLPLLREPEASTEFVFDRPSAVDLERRTALQSASVRTP